MEHNGETTKEDRSGHSRRRAVVKRCGMLLSTPRSKLGCIREMLSSLRCAAGNEERKGTRLRCQHYMYDSSQFASF